MPKGTLKPLHVTSSTTVKEVIEALLAKYSVTDNPKKYALFEQFNKKTDGEKKEGKLVSSVKITFSCSANYLISTEDGTSCISCINKNIGNEFSHSENI